MVRTQRFTGQNALINKVTSDKSSPDEGELIEICDKAYDHKEIPSLTEVNKLVNLCGSESFPDLQHVVLDTANDVRKALYGGKVLVMAPIEVGNICASQCDFCGWQRDNKEMVRSRVPKEIVLEQARYLIGKGIYTIELVCGDDPKMVREEFPDLIREVRQLFPPQIKGRIQICTMALTKKQYEMMKEAGADGMIVWQESYDRDVYSKHITGGPKAFGMNEDWTVDRNGDGFKFRLQSQDRALEAGLEVALGSMLGLNPDTGPEIISTILHARHLIERGVNEEHPLIVGIPTWNRIPTPSADKRPLDIIDADQIYAYIAAVYFLSLPKGKAWIFPNCRVPIQTQIAAIEAGGVFTSTEVKLGPAGYMPAVLRDAMLRNDGDAVQRIKRMMTEHLGTEFADLEALSTFLDQREQFCHHYSTHHDFKKAFHDADLNIFAGTHVPMNRTLERMRASHKRRSARELASGLYDFIAYNGFGRGTPRRRRAAGSGGK